MAGDQSKVYNIRKNIIENGDPSTGSHRFLGYLPYFNKRNEYDTWELIK